MAENTSKDLSAERDKRCIPIARAILRMLAEPADLCIGSAATVTDEELIQYYGNMYQTVLAPYLLEQNVLLDEVHYIFTIAAQAIDQLRERTEMTLEARELEAVAHLYGVKTTETLTVNDVQRVLLERNAKATA